MDKLINFFTENKFNFKIIDQKKDACILEFEVHAKPGSKKEQIFLKEGILNVAMNARPIEGEANKSIIECLAKSLGLSKSNLEITSGLKSKNKKINILFEVSATKNEKYFLEKISSLV